MGLPVEPSSPKSLIPVVKPCASYFPGASTFGTTNRKRRTILTSHTARRAIFVAIILFVALVPVVLHRQVYDQVAQEQLAPFLKGWLDVNLIKEENTASINRTEAKDTQATSSENIRAGQPYAYAYLVGGCKPEAPSYRYYIYDIMVNTEMQRKEGSTADVVVLVQMKFDSAHEKLPEEDQRFLDTMNIKVEYIPKAKDESFYRLMHDKFLILRMTQYKRIMFLDGDVMIRGSMDYLFELSTKGILKENLVIAGKTEPASGGIFMLTPKEGSWNRLLDIIRKKEARGRAMPYPHWNGTIGWGHALEEGDEMEFLTGKKNKTWEFHGAYADQGLLYHWTKYEEKSVSIVFARLIQNWGSNENDKAHKESEIQLENLEYEGGVKLVKRDYCWKSQIHWMECKPIFSDFVHFTGIRKPWLHGPPRDFGVVKEHESAEHLWFHVLDNLNKKLDMKLDFGNWTKDQRPSLGLVLTREGVVVHTRYGGTK